MVWVDVLWSTWLRILSFLIFIHRTPVFVSLYFYFVTSAFVIFCSLKCWYKHIKFHSFSKEFLLSSSIQNECCLFLFCCWLFFVFLKYEDKRESWLISLFIKFIVLICECINSFLYTLQPNRLNHFAALKWPSE